MSVKRLFVAALAAALFMVPLAYADNNDYPNWVSPSVRGYGIYGADTHGLGIGIGNIPIGPAEGYFGIEVDRNTPPSPAGMSSEEDTLAVALGIDVPMHDWIDVTVYGLLGFTMLEDQDGNILSTDTVFNPGAGVQVAWPIIPDASLDLLVGARATERGDLSGTLGVSWR